MTTSATAAPAVRAAFAQFIDYAGLFPPAKLDMPAALAEYAAARSGPFAWMLGRFIVPASRIPELLAALPAGEPLGLSVIVDSAGDPRTWLSATQSALAKLAEVSARETRVKIEALEIALPPLATQRETYDAFAGQFDAARKQAGLQALPAFVEIPRDARWRSELGSALFALARHRLGAKLRCGGVVAEAFPSAQDVAAFIATAVGEHGIAMKATAGLHHPIRRRDESLDAMMHGFVNLLAAASFARAGASESEVLGIVECEDPSRFRFGEGHLSAQELQATRERCFIAYGSCSFSEPTEDLQSLGIL